jgi:2'-5' RNA ligase
MRLFIALDLSEAVHERVEEVEKRERYKLDARWVPPANMHLTLVFLGETDAQKVPEILASCQEATAHFPQLTLAIHGAGTFGSRTHPRVLWLGVGGSESALQALVADLERRLGVESKRPYEAHLTLARARSMKGDSKLIKVAERLKSAELGAWKVDHLTLYESRGGRYLPLGTAALQA